MKPRADDISATVEASLQPDGISYSAETRSCENGPQRAQAPCKKAPCEGKCEEASSTTLREAAGRHQLQRWDPSAAVAADFARGGVPVTEREAARHHQLQSEKRPEAETSLQVDVVSSSGRNSPCENGRHVQQVSCEEAASASVRGGGFSYSDILADAMDLFRLY